MTFAQTASGRAENPCDGLTLEDALASSFHPDFVAREISAGRPWVSVPQGTLHGAMDNGDGTFTNPPQNQLPEFPTLTGSQFITLVGKALGFSRLDQLLAKSKSVEALLMKAVFVDRNTGNTPAAIAYLQTGDSALTDDELGLIDTAWRAF